MKFAETLAAVFCVLCALFALYLGVYAFIFRPVMVAQQIRAEMWGEWDDCAPHGSADYRCTWKEI